MLPRYLPHPSSIPYTLLHFHSATYAICIRTPVLPTFTMPLPDSTYDVDTCERLKIELLTSRHESSLTNLVTAIDPISTGGYMWEWFFVLTSAAAVMNDDLETAESMSVNREFLCQYSFMGCRDIFKSLVTIISIGNNPSVKSLYETTAA